MALQLPVIFLLSTHLQPTEQHELEDKIPTLTYDVNEAEVVLGKISRRERALFELRRLQLDTDPVVAESLGLAGRLKSDVEPKQPEAKRQKTCPSAAKEQGDKDVPGDRITVLKLSWLTDSIKQGAVMPMAGYIVYEGIKRAAKAASDEVGGGIGSRKQEPGSNILERAAEDYQGAAVMKPFSRTVSTIRTGENTSDTPSVRGRNQPAALARESTSDHDAMLPLIPEYLHTTYSCQRPSPVSPPNSKFIEELKCIRLLRLLQGDQIGVRAYSTSISALTAYPHQAQSPQGMRAV